MSANEKSTVDHTDHRKRMRERIAQGGINNLKDHEILEFMLYPFIPRKNTNDIAHALIDKFGSLAGVFESGAEALGTVGGMTENAALYFASMSQVYVRYQLSKFGAKPKLSTPIEITAYCKGMMATLNEEHIYLLAVDNAGYLITKCEIGNGGIEDCKLAVRKLVLLCQNAQAPNAYIVHNHPSGVAEPSVADIEFTKWAVIMTELMDVYLVDHIIVARGEIYSFLFDGNLAAFRKNYDNFIGNEKITDTLR